MNNRITPRYRQHGVVLILIAFIIGLGAAAFMYRMFNASSLQVEQDEKTMRVLSEAKSALIAWAVSHPNHPGQMPYPDRNGDGNYDGYSDCFATNVSFSYSFLLGRLPIHGVDPNCNNHGITVNAALGADFRDASGERLWYAVSKNLVHDYNGTGSDPVINPGIANVASDWLEVVDRNGNLISNRVAAVIIAPGTPVGDQDRSGAAPEAREYLDRIVRSADGVPFKNYALPPLETNQFIMGEDIRRVGDNDLIFQKPYNFNDKLIFITVDELLAVLETRAANELKNALLNYYEPASAERPNGRGMGYFPYAASLGSSKDYACVTSNTAGVLPISDISPPNFTCSYNRSGSPRVTSVSCTTGFSNLNSIQFERNANDFNASVGACSFSGRVCTCRGAGSCSRITATTQTFSSDAAGNCVTSATTGSLNGTVTFSGGEFTSSTPRCSLACVNAVCSGNGAGSASRASTCSDAIFNTGSSSLPAWIMTNKWYDYFYYASSRSGVQLTSGSKGNVDSLLIGTGRSILVPGRAVSKNADQARPSCAVNDYLDSNENADADEVFDGVSLTRNRNYNDHTYIVMP